MDEAAKDQLFSDIGIQVDQSALMGIQHRETPPPSEISTKSHTEGNTIEHRIGTGNQPDIRRTERQLRQVGLVKVLVEVQALSQQYLARGGSEDQSESELDESDQVQEGNNHEYGRDTMNYGGVDNLGSSQISDEYTNGNGATRKRGGEDGEDDRDDNKRACRRPPGSQQHVGLRRLACPYQAYERYQVCLRPGRSNTEGGCNGISRLKSVFWLLLSQCLAYIKS